MAKNASSSVGTSSTKARAPRAKKTDSVVMNHTATLSADDELASLMAALGPAPDMVEIEPDQTITEADLAAIDDLIEPDLEALLAEPVEMLADAPVETEVSFADLEIAVGRAEAVEAVIEAAGTDEIVDGAAPSADGAKTKKAAAPRKHYSDKVERLKDRVGASLAEYTVLTTADALVDDAELAVTMERTLEIIRQMNSKEKNRASNLIEFLSGKRAKLNNVLERVLKVLDSDGFLQTGNDGNVMKNLLARPYSPASARAMGGNTVSMYADLKLIVPEGKGRFIANPDSLLLAKARSLLAGAPASEEGAEDEATAE